jgi:hypothetical protein
MSDGSWIVMIATGVLLVAAIAMIVYLHKLISRHQSELVAQGKIIQTMENDLRALAAGAVGTDGRLSQLEKRSRSIKQRQEQLELRDGSRPYDQAIRMVHRGSSIDEIVSLCDLSRGEAELIQMMHGVDKAS